MRGEHKLSYEDKLSVSSQPQLPLHPDLTVRGLHSCRPALPVCFLRSAQTEMSRLQERTAQELEAIRARQREAYERDISSLKEARDGALLELTQLRQQQTQSLAAVEALRADCQQLQLSREQERSEGRQSLAVKQFEYERLALTAEEAMADMRRLKAELEAELKKNRILRNECRQLKDEGGRAAAEAEKQRLLLSERLATYQQLEHELDVAILSAGKDASVDAALLPGLHQAAAGGLSGIHRILESVSEHLPVSNKRRLQQSILLAQQLVDKQRQLVAAQAQLKDSQDRLGLAEAKVRETVTRRAAAATAAAVSLTRAHPCHSVRSWQPLCSSWRRCSSRKAISSQVRYSARGIGPGRFADAAAAFTYVSAAAVVGCSFEAEGR